MSVNRKWFLMVMINYDLAEQIDIRLPAGKWRCVLKFAVRWSVLENGAGVVKRFTGDDNPSAGRGFEFHR